MRNEFTATLTLKRIEICDLLLACTMAQFTANDGGEKWQRLHDKLNAQLEEIDRQLDEVVQSERF